MKTFTFKYAYVDYEVILTNDGVFISPYYFKELFSLNDEEIDSLIKEYEKSLNLDPNKSLIEVEYLPHYNLNILISYSLDKNPELINSIYLGIKKAKEEDKILPDLLKEMKKINSISEPSIPWDEYRDIFYSLKKEEEKDFNTRYHSYPPVISFIDVLNAVEQLKERYKLPKDFGVFEDFDKSYNIYEECFENDNGDNYEWYMAKLFYTICSKKPFLKYNEELAVISLLLFMSDYNLLYNEYNLAYKSSDFYRLIIIYEKYKDLTEEEVINKLIPVLCFTTLKELKKSDISLETFKQEPNIENAYRFIVDFLEEKSYRQGYYEYFSTKSNDCIKIHYHGYYCNFKLNYLKTMNNKDTLVFDCIAHAKTEAPNILKNRNSFALDRFEEIKSRSKNDILKQIREDLSSKFKGLIDLKAIKIELNPVWTLNSDLDYE